VDQDPDRLLERIRAGGLLPPGRPVIALLSGGRDSTCLLDVAVRLAGPGAVEALHVNYGLRPEAGEDERACAALCERLGLALTVERARRPEGAANLQAWARDVRYGAAARRALRRGAQVATGHTATDQAETILYRLAASPGRRALLGMPARDGLLVRPLLAVGREETAAYCRARGLAWREDASNELGSATSASYTRARVRHETLPALRAVHPAAEANLVHTAASLRDEAEVLDALVDSVLEGHDRIETARLAALPPAVGRLVVRRLAENAAGRLVPQAAARAPELLRLGDAGGSAALDLGGGLRALVEYGVLRFAAGAAEPAPSPVPLAVPGTVRFGTWDVRCEPAVAELAPGVLDAATLSGGLTVRAWRPGDRMAPLGLGGTRALSDLFADRRVPRERRRSLPVVEAAGEIAWVPDVAMGDRFRVTSATRRAVRLTARTAT
jgi:tRNA(Ile)-lysidine synthase